MGSEPLIADIARLFDERLPTLDQHLSKAAAAELLGVSRNDTLKRLIKSGALKTVVVGRRQKIPLSEIRRFLAQGERPVQDDQPQPRRPAAPRRPTVAQWQEPDWNAEIAKARKLRV